MPKLTKATDVVPGKIYVARIGGLVDRLIRVKCTESPGYLRGFVEVGSFSGGYGRFHGTVYVEDLLSNELKQIEVSRANADSEWIFSILLKELTKEFVDLLVEHRLAAIKKHEDEIAFLQRDIKVLSGLHNY